MATTSRSSSLTSILRAATSHRTPNTLLHPHHNLHRHYHHNYPASFLHSNPSNLQPHFPYYTSPFQRVHTLATAPLNPSSSYMSISNHPSNLQNSSPHTISACISRRVHTRATTLQNPGNPRSIWPFAVAFGCIATGGLTLIYKFQEKPFRGLKGTVTGTVTASASDEPSEEEGEVRIRAAFPGLYRKGYSVVVEGVGRPVSDKFWGYYFSVTQVLEKPKLVNAAMERNRSIMARKLQDADAEKLKLAYEKPRVADQEEEKLKVAIEKPRVTDKEKKKVANKKLQVAEEAERQARSDWYNAVIYKAIIKPAADPLKTKSQGNVYEYPLYPKTELTFTRSLKHLFVRFQGLSDLLQDGNSVFIMVIETRITDEIREGKSDEILEDMLADIKKDKSAKSLMVKGEDMEYHISVEVLTKHDSYLS